MKKIAAIVTEYRVNSHADVIVGKFLRGFPCDDGLHPPRVQIASIYIDQINANDTGINTGQQFSVPIYPSILKALTLGGDSLAVDGVLLVGEHGDYPANERGQKLYPRRHLFEQTAGVFAASGKVVPVFSDKHLSYNWPDARWMYDTAKRLSIPFMAGSSLPVCWRRPFLEHEIGAPLQAAVAIGYGPIETYGFHTLEVLQCMAERRKGGESGIRSVQMLEGSAVWEWLTDNASLRDLARSAASAIEQRNGSWDDLPQLVAEPAAFIVKYRDGFEGLALMLNGFCKSFAYAGLSNGSPEACEFVLQSGQPFAHFSYLSLNIEEMFLTEQPTYPAERTLVTTGILAAAMESRYQGCIPLDTPHLDIAYQPANTVAFRPMGPRPSGATLQPWPPESRP